MTPPRHAVMRPTSRRARLGAVLVGAALALTACQGEDTADEADEAEADEADGGELAAEDGWTDLDDLELPEPGTGVLRVAGEEIELDVECTQPGVLDGGPEDLLFDFSVQGFGEASDGHTVIVHGSREIVTPEEAEASDHDYPGQERGSIQVTTRDEEGRNQIAIMVSPSGSDPDGERLPVLRVDESGAFTVNRDVEPFDAVHEDSLHGPTELAGRCQDGWPHDLGE